MKYESIKSTVCHTRHTAEQPRSQGLLPFLIFFESGFQKKSKKEEALGTRLVNVTAFLFHLKKTSLLVSKLLQGRVLPPTS